VSGSEQQRRPRCPDCRRPAAACWCRFVTAVDTAHRIVVLQHPREARHRLNTVPILRRAIAGVTVHVGLRHPPDTVDDDALLVYPGGQPGAVPPGGPHTLVVIDGTWHQARTILAANPWLAGRRRLSLACPEPSAYYVRAQPNRHALSTVEAVAEAMVALGEPDGTRAALLRPLHALVGMHQACADAGGGDVLADPDLLTRTGYLPPVP
jgi:tRNA-uridine aminocarboxypropyltransferase